MFRKFLLLILVGYFGLDIAQAQHRYTRQCMEFDGLDDHVDCNSGNRNITNVLTIEAWVNTGSKKVQTIISKTSSNSGFCLAIQNGKASFNGVTNAGVMVGSGPSTSTVTDNHWHHLAGIYNSGLWQIWVDGILESSASGSNVTLANTANLFIGKNNQASTEFYKGLLAEIRIWNTPRTALQLQEFMCRTINPNQTSLTGYFTGDGRHPIVPTGILTDHSFFNLNGAIQTNNNNFNNTIYILGYPPVGDKSIFLYGSNFQNKNFKINGDGNDTLIVGQVTGQLKGIHVYRSDSIAAPILQYGILTMPTYFFGVYTVGDTNATYQAKLAYDTINCSFSYYIFKRFESPLRFNKKTLGSFNLVNDKSTRVTDRHRGEYTFPFISPKPKLLSQSRMPLCLPGLAKLTASAPSGKYFYWSTGDTTKSLVVTKPGKYTVWIDDLCTTLGYDTFRVEIAKPLAFPPVRSIPDTILCEGQKISFDLPGNFFYKWQDGSTNNQYEISQPGHYSLEITEPVCKTSMQYAFSVKTANCNEGVFIPNIITPNSDGLNDFFTIAGLPIKEYALQIFNRWGNLVYETENYQNNWNGNGLWGGIYYYFLRHQKSAKSYKGYVEVVK